jgi:DNA-binding NtrC family response regulator
MLDEKKYTILAVDDAKDNLELISRNLLSAGYTIITSESAEHAIEILESQQIDLVITDLKMPDVDGLQLTRHIRENFKDIEVIMITGYPSIEGAVEAVKMGASEYITKPFTDEELFSVVEKALFKVKMKKVGIAKAKSSENMIFPDLIGESSSMKRVKEAINKAASTSATALITGESGTGKEVVARAIHYTSERASQRFVPVNCGGIPEELLESELFGYVKGAFTGANETRAGFFQTADGGTIFLDEISETSISMQVKLLRVLQDKNVYMIGARKSQVIDVRIIAATNKDLQLLIGKNLFREDLFFRLNVINIELPPLRERGDDVLLLLKSFTEKFSREMGKSSPVFSPKAYEVLKEYTWPGNVRELENVVQRIVVMNEGEVVDVPDLPSLMRFSAIKGRKLNKTIQEIECEYIKDVLESQNNNKTNASEILGIDRKTLREKLKKCNIS